MTDFRKNKHPVAIVGIGEKSYKFSMSLDGRWFCNCGGSSCEHIRSYKDEIGYDENIIKTIKALIDTNNNQNLLDEWLRVKERVLLLQGLSPDIDKMILTLKRKVSIVMRYV